jgi:hypothetical protein
LATESPSPGAVRVAAANGQPERPSNGGRPVRAAWPKVQVKDPYTRDAATRALDGAVKWLTEVKCQRVFAEFTDGKGVPLGNRLREFETTPEGYLRMLYFFDGAQHATCRRHGILAFTAVGSRSVYLCGRDFERAWKKNAREVQAAIIHEMLHSLGLGENPPSARSINDRVQRLCAQ